MRHPIFRPFLNDQFSNSGNSMVPKQALFTASVIGGLVFSCAQAAATTVTVQSQSLGVNINRPASLVACSTTSTNNTEQCSNNNSDTVLGDNVSASGFSSVDIVTGELKASASGSADGIQAEGAISSLGSTTITETFSVTGTGTLTAYMDVDGLWNLFRLDGNTPIYQIQSSIGFSGAIANGSDNLVGLIFWGIR